MRMEKTLLAVLASILVASPALGEMAWVPVAAAPALSPLSLLGLGAVIGVAGIRILRNRRQG